MERLQGEQHLNRYQLEHILRAAGSIADQSEFIVIGSQAILGAYPDAPDSLLVSIEADLYPKHNPGLSDLIDGTIGELSPFHQTFGYYGHGVGPETAVLPKDWSERLTAICNENTRGVTGWCLPPTDLAYSKLAAGRPKDLDYVRQLRQHGILDERALIELIASTSDPLKENLEARFKVVCRSF